jgi:hypothetical protein
MADIIDIDVFQTVTSVSFEVEPNTNIININKVTSSGVGGATNLSTTQTASNFTINSDTGDDALVPLGNGTLAGATLNDYTTTEKNKLAAITGTNTGDQNLQSVTTLGASSTNPITITTPANNGLIGLTVTTNDNTSGSGIPSIKGIGVGDTVGILGASDEATAIVGVSINGNGTMGVSTSSNGLAGVSDSWDGVLGYSQSGFGGKFQGIDKGISVTAGNIIVAELNQGLTSKGLVINSGTSSTGNFIELDKNGVDKLVVNQAGELTATKLIKQGGTSSQFLKADGSVDSTSYTTAQNLQQVTNIGASTTNPINVTVTGASVGITGGSPNGKGINGYSETGIGVDGFSTTGIGVNGYSETGIAAQFETDGVANIANFKSSGSIVASVTNNGNINANGFVKSGGTSTEILAADGSVITAGTNITITGGQISSVGGTGGGGSSVNYYLNGGTSQGTFGGTTYYEFSKTAIIGTGADFNISSNGYIASFITDVADPSLLLIPAGNWNLEFFFSSSSAGGSPSFYVELYKYDGTTFTSIASSSANPEGITGGTAIDAYFTPLAVPETILTVNDRLAIRVFVNASSKTITLHTQNGHLCEVITTFTAGLTALNGLQAQVQNFATGTTGTDFAINSSGSTHTFNLPSASATARGVVTTASQTFAGDKTFTEAIGASNLSGTNTGDETITTIKTKLGITTLSGSNTGDQDLSGYALLASPTFTGTPSLPTGTTGTTQTPLNNSTKLATTAYVEAACAVVASSGGVSVSAQDTFGTANIATVTAAQYAAFVTAGTVSATTLYFITA